MGTDKALIEIDGRAMARRVADGLAAAGAATVVAIGGDEDALRAAGLEVRSDRWPGEGPLGAVIHALDVAGTQPVVAVLACDLLHPDPEVIARLVAHRARTDADVAVAVAAARPQWAHAVWHRRVAGVLGDVFASGERSLVGATVGLRTELVIVADPRSTQDADRPDDLPAGARRRPPGPLPTLPSVDVPAIDIETLQQRMETGAPVFDVRQPDEYAVAHVPGVRLVPLAEVPDRAAEFPAEGEVFVICQSGGRSARAVEFLRARGVDAVNVAGGTKAWLEAGKPVEHGA